MPCGNDDERNKAGGADQARLEEAGVVVSVKEFPNMTHGFVLRGDTTDSAVAADIENALDLVVAFITENCT